MGYFLKAFLGEEKNLKLIIEKHSESSLIRLTTKVSMIPMTDALYNQIRNTKVSPCVDKFELLTESIERKIIQTIEMRELAYVESEFHGGEGGHIGIIWKEGKRDYFGKFAKETMNEILKRLGVNRTIKNDEFEIAGLLRFRQTKDWIK